MSQGIQDNKQQKVDLIYTKRGRFLKSINSPKARITKFALSDDGVDYNLYNANAVEGEQGLRIMRTPQLESFTSETGMMRNKLISMERDVTETAQMEVSPESLVFEVDPNTSSKEFVEAVAIRAQFPAPNGFIVSLDNAEYVYVNEPPAIQADFPEELEPTLPPADDRDRDPDQGGRTRGGDRQDDQVRTSGFRNQGAQTVQDFERPRRPVINTKFKGERPQRIIVGKNNSAPNETIIRVYYSDRYKKFTEDVPIKTRLVIESIDGGYSKEVEIEVRKQS